jgi:hypothetical protein
MGTIAITERVWEWPEYKAFAERLGIVMHKNTLSVEIRLHLRGAAVVTSEYFPEEKIPKPKEDEP